MFNNSRIVSLLCCLVLSACGGQTVAESGTGTTGSFDAEATAEPDTAGVGVEGGADQAESPNSETSRCPLVRGIGLDASEYLDLGEDQAEALASEAGLRLIVECRDGELLIPARLANIDQSRLWVSIDNGIVTSAYRG